MQKDVKSSHTESALASVSLPPLPARSAHAPGGALRLQLASRPPTPPPRPESSLHGPPPPAPVSSSTPASGQELKRAFFKEKKIVFKKNLWNDLRILSKRRLIFNYFCGQQNSLFYIGLCES